MPLDARIVAATHPDLAELVAAGRFDGELYELLAAAAIEIPPLRERREDIPALAEHFRRQVNAREGRRVPGFALDVMRRLSQHDWPGNVRELEHLVERLVVIAGTRMVVMKDLPSHLRIQVIDLERATRRLPASGVDLRVLLTELEERLIAEALARTGGNRNRAAELLGIEPHDAGREASAPLRRLTKENTHISVGERPAPSPTPTSVDVGILETVTRLTAS